MDLEVLEAIADVHGAKLVRLASVEELVARPLEGTNHDSLVALIHLEGPRAAWLVIFCRLEETLVEWGRRKIELSALCLILHVAEVQVATKAHTCLAGKAIESLIAANLMLWGHFESANWADLAIVLNGVNGGRQTIKL